MYLGMRNGQEEWDWARCHVEYAGLVNMPYRRYTVTDHFDVNRPYYGGLDEHLKKDKYQDWIID